MSDDPRNREVSEVVTAALLAAATVASAWCAYQAALWSGEQTRRLAEANSAHFESLGKSSAANVEILVDVAAFMNYLGSEARGERSTAEYIRAHVRKEFRPVLERWIAERKADRESDPPFEPPGYRLAALDAAGELEKQADAATQAANLANSYSDLFVLHTVLFATALFFLGSSSTARRLGVRRAMTIMGALALVLSIISMVGLPRAPSTPDRRELRAARRSG